MIGFKMRHLFVASLLFADWCWRDPDSSCETDVDGDGWATCHDCDDEDPDVNPGQVDVIGNCLDEDCDGVYELSSESEDLAEAGAVILCGQGTEEVGTAVLSLSETAPGTDALAVGAPLRNASGSVYLIEGAALKDRAGLLLPLLDVASLEIQAAPDQKDEAGSALAALSLDEDEAPQLFIGAPGFSNTQRAGAGAVYMISTGLEPGTTTLEWPSDDQCPTDLCLVNTFADGARLG
ncbi:hypothetical protein DYH09_31950, partial [bacterium CPR1]|nr:hypothetical protein [bacterium CPR1]